MCGKFTACVAAADFCALLFLCGASNEDIVYSLAYRRRSSTSSSSSDSDDEKAINKRIEEARKREEEERKAEAERQRLMLVHTRS